MKTNPVAKIATTNIFFQDFLIFLRLLEKRFLELTQTGTGNLKIKEIKTLGRLFKHDIYHRDSQGKIMFQPRTEDEFRYIMWIRQMSAVMSLVYKRKGKLNLSKKGKDYLSNLSQKSQYEHLVIAYLHRANWGYIHPREEIANKLSENQNQIWTYLLNEDGWVNFSQFVKALNLLFNLSPKKVQSEYAHDAAIWTIECVLVKNLRELGLLKIKKKKDKYGFKEISAFRLTPAGKEILGKALLAF